VKGKYHNISGILASFCVAAGVGIATAVFLVVVSIFLPEEAVHFLDDYGDYITGIESGEPIEMLEHWGVYAISVGFFLYLVIRVLMTLVRRSYRANMPPV